MFGTRKMMRRKQARGSLVKLPVSTTLLCCALVSCSQADTSDPFGTLVDQHSAPATAATISSAAAALSVQFSSPGMQDGSSYERALRCRAASTVVVERVRQLPIAGESEINLLVEAGQLFQRQLDALARSEPKSSQEVIEDLRLAIETAREDMAQQGRVLMECVRSIESS